MAIPICRNDFDKAMIKLERLLREGNKRVMDRVENLEKHSRYSSKKIEDFLKTQAKKSGEKKDA